MSDFQVKSDNVDVEQIMRQIRTRIREKRGVDYTEDEIRELANVKLEKFIDPKGVRSDLLQQYRQAREAKLPPNFKFEDTTLFETHRGPLAFIRRLLRPILKLFFNPNPLIEALHIQSKLNAAHAAVEPLHFEIIHNLVLELTRTSIEVKSLKMRLESMASRLDFDERRARALEGVVQYRPGAVAPLQPPPGQDQGRRDQGRRDGRQGGRDRDRDQRDQGGRDRGPRDYRPREQGPREQPPREQAPREQTAAEPASQPPRPEGLEPNALDNDGNDRRARRRRRRGRRRSAFPAGASAAGDSDSGFGEAGSAPDRDEGEPGVDAAAGDDRGADIEEAPSTIGHRSSDVDDRPPDAANAPSTISEPRPEPAPPQPREHDEGRGEGGPVPPQPREHDEERGEGG
jgi:hypothetical protein